MVEGYPQIAILTVKFFLNGSKADPLYLLSLKLKSQKLNGIL